MGLADRLAAQEAFWSGRGPSLILIPATHAPQYDTHNYTTRFYDPLAMWEAEMRRACETIEWPTDGIPTVRPNLGVVFVPAASGQPYAIQEGQMPWPGAPLSRDEIRRLPERNVEASPVMGLARAFYEVHRANGNRSVYAYHPDTQGVFSLAHLFYGDRIFTDLVDDTEWITELLEITLSTHSRVVCALKRWIPESDTEMVHGHSFPAGIWFPRAGVRISEDTATMLAPRMVSEYVLPFVSRAAAPWGGCFVHFCGRHRFLFEQLCRIPEVRAIDLGNPEMYDTEWLFAICAETGTVLFSPVKAEEGETWEPYVRRVAELAKRTGARLILRPAVFPETRDECTRMRDLWHELTS